MNHRNLIRSFINNRTNHKEVVNIRKSPKSGYVVKVKDIKGLFHKVNFWIDDLNRTIAYGIAGWGICIKIDWNQI